jgi:hypothetical protein
MCPHSCAPFLGYVDLSNRTAAPERVQYSSYKEDDYDKFNKLLIQWRLETYFTSLVKEKIENPSVQKLLSFGPQAIPWILKEIRHRPDFLVMALGFLAKENPVQPSSRGKIEEIVNDWIVWADRNSADAN